MTKKPTYENRDYGYNPPVESYHEPEVHHWVVPLSHRRHDRRIRAPKKRGPRGPSFGGFGDNAFFDAFGDDGSSKKKEDDDAYVDEFEVNNDFDTDDVLESILGNIPKNKDMTAKGHKLKKDEIE